MHQSTGDILFSLSLASRFLEKKSTKTLMDQWPPLLPLFFLLSFLEKKPTKASLDQWPPLLPIWSNDRSQAAMISFFNFGGLSSFCSFPQLCKERKQLNDWSQLAWSPFLSNSLPVLCSILYLGEQMPNQPHIIVCHFPSSASLSLVEVMLPYGG